MASQITDEQAAADLARAKARIAARAAAAPPPPPEVRDRLAALLAFRPGDHHHDHGDRPGGNHPQKAGGRSG